LALRLIAANGVLIEGFRPGVMERLGLTHTMLAQGKWSEARGQNWLDGGAPYYRCCSCACGGFIAVAVREPQFHALLLE